MLRRSLCQGRRAKTCLVSWLPYFFICGFWMIGAQGAQAARYADCRNVVAHLRAGALSVADLQQLARDGRAGDARSAQLLAWLLATGKEMRPNLRLALIWYLQSYVNGMPASLRDARLVLAHMTRADVAALNPMILALATTGRFVPPRLASPDPNAAQIRAILREEAESAHLVPALAEAVGYVESRFHPAAVSAKGALGVMQIMPATGAAFQVAPADLFDPRTNIRTGVRYLNGLIQQYGRVDKALAHYVGGTSAALAYPAVSAEVQHYVADVLTAAPQFAALNGAPVVQSIAVAPPIQRPGSAGSLSPSPLTQIASAAAPASKKPGPKGMTRRGSVLILRGGSDS